jgi:AcrR family transcriptional regulator
VTSCNAQLLHESAASDQTTARVGPKDPLYDPLRPILHHRSAPAAPASVGRQNQRLRRSQILAVIRRLLMERGFEGVTVRRVAEVSGHAVQTIYSLVGPRNYAIIDAIGEYTRFVGRTATPRADDPRAVIGIVDRWMQSIEMNPEFCRQVSLIFFTEARGVFYTFRDQQLLCMIGLLRRQQRCGVLHAAVNVRDLAEQLVLLSSALCLEWSDRPFPLERLHARLRSGCENLLAGAAASAAPR